MRPATYNQSLPESRRQALRLPLKEFAMQPIFSTSCAGLSDLPVVRAPVSRALRAGLLACVLAGMSVVLSGCFPVVATGVVAGALSVADRRTTGAQTEDQAIEIKAANRFRDTFKSDQVSLTVVSFNRIALVTGFVPDEKTRAEAVRLVTAIENVRGVLNEIVIGSPPPSLASYGSDSLITARVKSALIDSRDLQGHAIKVFTESSVVYLMGIVTEREARLASQIASRVAGVRRVVQAFEIITEAELERLQAQLGMERQPRTAPSGATGSAGARPASSPAPAGGSGAAPSPDPRSQGAPAHQGGTVVTPIR